MLDALKERRPWLAAVIGLFGPYLAMLFLNRGRLALVYFGAILLFVAGGLMTLPAIKPHSSTANIFQYGPSIITIVGAVHAFLIARDWDADQRLRWYARYWYLFAILTYGYVGGLLIIRTYLYQPFDVPSVAMLPTVNARDYFLASKSAYRTSKPDRGDIVVFRPVAFPGVVFFKRIVGLPGDRIQLKDSILYINGAPLPRTRLPDFQTRCDEGLCNAAQYKETLPSGRSYNIIQLNSRGPYDDTQEFTVPPESYFVLGDNRDNSADSRNELGYIPLDRIFGRAAYKYITNGHWTWQAIH